MANNNIKEKEMLLTQHGYDELVRELEERKELRDVIADEIDHARELGDLSENASYTVAMEKKELNENKIDEIESILAIAKVVEEKKNDVVITIGRMVEIQNLGDNSTKVIHLVGATEADPVKGKVSIESPLGKAILNSKIGDTINVDLQNGSVSYKTLKFVDKN